MRAALPAAFVLASLAGCNSATNPPASLDGGTDAAACGQNSAVVVTGAFPNPLGGINRVGLADHAVVKGIDNSIDSDTVVRAAAGKVYALLRVRGVMRLYDTASCFANPIEIAIGDADAPHERSDPTDALPVTDTSKVYVAAYGNDAAHAIAVVDTSLSPPAVKGWVSVPAAAGSTKPRATQLWACGALVYAVFEDLDDSFTIKGPGRIGVIDPHTDALVSDGKPSMFALAGTNPGGGFPYGVTPFDNSCDDVLVADAGDLSTTAVDRGGIERVDLANRATRGMLWRGSIAFQANVGAIASAGPHLLYAVIGSASNQVIALDQTAVARLGDVLGPAGYIPFVQVSRDHQVWIGVNFSMGTQPATGLYLAPADGAKITAPPLTFEQPPYGIAFP